MKITTSTIIAFVLTSLLFLVSGFIAGNVTHGPFMTTITMTNTQTATQIVQVTASETPKSEEWHEVIRFEDTKDVFLVNTESFNIPTNTWRIRWSYTGSADSSKMVFFGFGVNLVGQQKSVVRIASPKISDSAITYVTGAGVFYIDLLTTNVIMWTIIVEVTA